MTKPWRLAGCLRDLLDEVNAAHPGRSTKHDGTIGDEAHAARTSDHNPDRGVVEAVDITAEAWTEALADRLRALGRAGDPRMAGGYVIFRRRIASPRQDWAWRKYTGSNPHEAHLHVSCTDDPDHYDAPGAWLEPPRRRAEPVASRSETRTAVPTEGETMYLAQDTITKGYWLCVGVSSKGTVVDTATLAAFREAGVREIALPQRQIDAIPVAK